MEITNISGPDTMPRGFSSEPPRQEEIRPSEPEPVNRNPEPSENSRGTTIDTYA